MCGFHRPEKALSLVEAGVKQDPGRITGAPFLCEDPGSSSGRTSDAHHPPRRWVGCVRILSYAYVLVSAGDTAGDEWCTMDGALAHLNVADQYARWGSKTNDSPHTLLAEAETTIRHERHRLMQQDKTITLDGAIELTNRYSFFLTNP